MQTTIANFTEQDSQAVRAVRTGDAERYRELVERHQRRVYAVNENGPGARDVVGRATALVINAQHKLTVQNQVATLGDEPTSRSTEAAEATSGSTLTASTISRKENRMEHLLERAGASRRLG